MKALKSFLGYAWAAAALVITLGTFLGHTHFSKGLAEATGITIHPRYSGGGIIKTFDHEKYKTAMHRPVFDGLIGQARAGFIQINWEPAGGLPKMIHEGFDYDGNGIEDFDVSLNTDTGETRLITSNPAVMGMRKANRLRDGWAVRVLLKRQPDKIP
jgi:hypothetical protein